MNTRAKRSLRWVTILFGGGLLLCVLFLVEEHVRGRVMLDRYLKQMGEHGEKFSIKELTPVPAFPDQNGAGMMMGVNLPQNKLLTYQVPPSMRFVADGVAIPAASLRVWLISGESEIRYATNAAGLHVETNTPSTVVTSNAPVGRGRGSRTLPPPKPWKIVTALDVATELAPHSNSLAQVRAALARPQLDHQIPYWMGFRALLPHLAREKTASQWLRVASLSALQETNLNASLENLLALASLAHATTNEPMMINQLVRIAVINITAFAIWEALQVEGWSEEQLATLQAALAPDDFVSSMARSLEMERAMGILEIERSAKDFLNSGTGMTWTMPSLPPESVEEVIAPFKELLDNVRPAFARYVYLPFWRVAWMDQDKLHLMKYWQRQIDGLRRQAAQPNWLANQAQNDAPEEWSIDVRPQGNLEYRYNRIRFLCSSMMVGSGNRAVLRSVDGEMTQGLARTAIALRRYRLAHRNHPESLEQLVPAFLSAVPIDPFDGKPLRYRRNADGGFTLYSVGEDGKDDGGNAAPKNVQANPGFNRGRDVVWPRAATEKEIQDFGDGSNLPKRPRPSSP